MSERATLEALLARVLEGKGLDRELDAEIWRSAEPAAFTAPHGLDCKPWRYIGNGVWRDDSDPEGHNKAFAPPYTASLDAALTMLPDGWRYDLSSGDLVEKPAARLTPDCAGPHFEGHAQTVPRAVIAACIKPKGNLEPQR